jgi:hypothetical protein
VFPANFKKQAINPVVMQEIRSDGVYFNGRRVWVNPTPGIWRNLHVHHVNDEVWVNGHMVYKDSVTNNSHRSTSNSSMKVIVALSITGIVVLAAVMCHNFL